MRVLFVIDSLTIGGAERVVVNLAKNFHKRGVKSSVVILRNENFFKKELKNIPVYVLNKCGRFDFSILYKLRKLIKKIKPDIINTHLFTASFWTKLATIFLKIPIYEVHHNVLWEEKWYTSFHKLLNKMTNFKVKKHIFVSHDVMNFYKKIEHISGIVIYNGIEIEKYPFKTERNKNELLFIGRLIERKGVRDLIKLEKLLPPDYHLIICGIGPMEEYIRKNKKKETLFLKGCKSQMVLKDAGILLMPSYWEGFSMVILEALASGVPIITYRVKGNINNPLKKYFYMIERGNINQILNIILHFSYNYDKMKKARDEIEKKYSVEKMADNYLKVFKS